MKSVKQLNKSQRPREKLQVIGATNLDEAELLALILGSGSKTANVLTLAKRLLKRFGGLSNLAQTSSEDLSQLKGIGQIQAGKLIACFELSQRLEQSQQLKVITQPQAVAQEVQEITTKRQEYFVALYLNARHQLLKKQTIAIGSLNQMMIEPREVFAPALQLPCSEIILAHNHPSSDPTPSPDDLEFTSQLVSAGKLLGIKIIDHVIVATSGWKSFRELNLI